MSGSRRRQKKYMQCPDCKAQTFEITKKKELVILTCACCGEDIFLDRHKSPLYRDLYMVRVPRKPCKDLPEITIVSEYREKLRKKEERRKELKALREKYDREKALRQKASSDKPESGNEERETS